MNKKGFTLVEMLLVVVLIAIVSLITLPNVMDMLNESKEEKQEQLYETIKESLKLYRIDHKEDLNWTGNKEIVTYEELKTSNKDLELDNCNATDFEIIRTPKDTMGDMSYNYTYKICLICLNESNKEIEYGDCE